MVSIYKTLSSAETEAEWWRDKCWVNQRGQKPQELRRGLYLVAVVTAEAPAACWWTVINRAMDRPLFREDRTYNNQDLRLRRTEGTVLQKDGNQSRKSNIINDSSSMFKTSPLKKHKLLKHCLWSNSRSFQETRTRRTFIPPTRS